MRSLRLPPMPAWIIERLEGAGHEAGLVGGCLRDLLLGRPVKDVDLATSALPSEVRALFPELRILSQGEPYGTLTLLAEGGPVEVTTFRTEGGYRDRRHPEQVSFTRVLEEDLRRRDFTVNALFYSPRRGLTDLHGGLEDLAAKRLRAIGSPRERFAEDPLRILRGLRFAAVLGFSVEEGTAAAMLEGASLLSHVSGERIAVELGGFLSGEGTTGLLQRFESVFRVLLPELVSFDPDFIGGQGSALLRLAALLSGIPGREVREGAVRRLRLSCSPVFERGDLSRAVLLGDFLAVPVQDSPEGLADLLEACGREPEVLGLLLSLRGLHPSTPLPSLSFRDLALGGEALLELGFRGEAVGRCLGFLYRGVLLGRWPNDREGLLEAARGLCDQVTDGLAREG